MLIFSSKSSWPRRLAARHDGDLSKTSISPRCDADPNSAASGVGSVHQFLLSRDRIDHHVLTSIRKNQDTAMGNRYVQTHPLKLAKMTAANALTEFLDDYLLALAMVRI